MIGNEIVYKFKTSDTRVKMCPTVFCCCKCGVDIKLNRCQGMCGTTGRYV